MTHVSRARPHVPNGKPLGRHIKTSGGGKHVLREAPTPRTVPPGASAVAQRYRVAVKAMAVMSLSSGIIGTVALPAYAVDPDEQNAGRQSAGKEPGTPGEQPAAEPQTVVVAADAEPVDAARDQIGATTVEELDAQREREEAERRAREQAEREAEALQAAGPSADSSSAEAPAPPPAPQASAPAPSANGGSIVSVARQFLGVPYVFGGASPSGFDCSGLVLHVYGKFGISLPHSALAQGANGTRVSDPVPGDLVVIDGGNHIGIYTGSGNMIDAPMPGRVVNERPIYTANHYFVRY